MSTLEDLEKEVFVMAKIYFRTDGNEEIATGHIMRCLSIARACATLHAEVSFLVSDEQSMTILAERFTSPNEFTIQCLHSNFQELEKELPVLKKLLTDSNPSKSDTWLFIDSYFVTKNYLSEEELQILNRMVSAYLDVAEIKALRRKAMTMKEWIEELDSFKYSMVATAIKSFIYFIYFFKQQKIQFFRTGFFAFSFLF